MQRSGINICTYTRTYTQCKRRSLRCLETKRGPHDRTMSRIFKKLFMCAVPQSDREERSSRSMKMKASHELEETDAELKAVRQPDAACPRCCLTCCHLPVKNNHLLSPTIRTSNKYIPTYPMACYIIKMCLTLFSNSIYIVIILDLWVRPLIFNVHIYHACMLYLCNGELYIAIGWQPRCTRACIPTRPHSVLFGLSSPTTPRPHLVHASIPGQMPRL